MFDGYFDELDPFKRKAILDDLEGKLTSVTYPESEAADQTEPGEEALSASDAMKELEQLRRLFSIRYNYGKKVRTKKQQKEAVRETKEALKEDKKNNVPRSERRNKVPDEPAYNDGFIAKLVLIRNIGFNPREGPGSRQDEKDFKEAVHDLCLDRRDEFTEDVLYREMLQLIAVYIDTALDDNHYQSILFGMGHMKRDQIRAKLELDMHYFWNPFRRFGMEDDYLFFKNAIMESMDKYSLRS